MCCTGGTTMSKAHYRIEFQSPKPCSFKKAISNYFKSTGFNYIMPGILRFSSDGINLLPFTKAFFGDEQLWVSTHFWGLIFGKRIPGDPAIKVLIQTPSLIGWQRSVLVSQLCYCVATLSHWLSTETTISHFSSYNRQTTVVTTRKRAWNQQHRDVTKAKKVKK